MECKDPAERSIALRSQRMPNSSSNTPTATRRVSRGTKRSSGPKAKTSITSNTQPAAAPARAERAPRTVHTARTIVELQQTRRMTPGTMRVLLVRVLSRHSYLPSDIIFVPVGPRLYVSQPIRASDPKTSAGQRNPSKIGSELSSMRSGFLSRRPLQPLDALSVSAGRRKARTDGNKDNCRSAI